MRRVVGCARRGLRVCVCMGAHRAAAGMARRQARGARGARPAARTVHRPPACPERDAGLELCADLRGELRLPELVRDQRELAEAAEHLARVVGVARAHLRHASGRGMHRRGVCVGFLSRHTDSLPAAPTGACMQPAQARVPSCAHLIVCGQLPLRVHAQRLEQRLAVRGRDSVHRAPADGQQRVGQQPGGGGREKGVTGRAYDTGGAWGWVG